MQYYSRVLEQLVPCRRCGKKDRIEMSNPGPTVTIKCKRCDCGMSGDNWEDITQKWNIHNFDAADFYITDQENRMK